MAGEGEQKNGTESKDGAAPVANIEMVPKAELLRVQGEKGPLVARIKQLEAEVASNKDRDELREKGAKSTPTDEERQKHEADILAYRAERRKFDEERLAFAEEQKRHQGSVREFLIARLATQYPAVKPEELQALGETVSAEGLELHAAKTQLQRQTIAPKKPSLSDKTLDTAGGGQAGVEKKTLTSQEKIRLGTQQAIERSMAQREALVMSAPPRRGA